MTYLLCPHFCLCMVICCFAARTEESKDIYPTEETDESREEDDMWKKLKDFAGYFLPSTFKLPKSLDSLPASISYSIDYYTIDQLL